MGIEWNEYTRSFYHSKLLLSDEADSLSWSWDVSGGMVTAHLAYEACFAGSITVDT